MKHVLILWCLLAFAGCMTDSVVTKAHRTTVALRMDDGTCSGTAVGRHLLLTATHCLEGLQHLAIDGNAVAVKKIVSDDKDHSLVVVDKTFESWAFVGDAPVQGDEVFILGNPGRMQDLYRHGYVSGQTNAGPIVVTLYDVNGYYGDSGSGIFNSRGQLVAVVSVLYQQEDGAYMKLMGSFPLAFTDEQWQEARRD